MSLTAFEREGKAAKQTEDWTNTHRKLSLVIEKERDGHFAPII